MKYIVTGSTATQPQHAVADFIQQGHYQTHLRRMRQVYQRNYDTFSCWVRHYFPCGICVTRPQGGFLMWIELPEAFDAVQLNHELRKSGIQIAVGSLFSASGKYRNCLRLNYALPSSSKIEQALALTGKAVERAMAACAHQPSADLSAVIDIIASGSEKQGQKEEGTGLVRPSRPDASDFKGQKKAAPVAMFIAVRGFPVFICLLHHVRVYLRDRVVNARIRAQQAVTARGWPPASPLPA